MPTRIRVIGPGGAGKTRLARVLSHRLGLPYLELDALHHRADWQEAPVEEFRAALRRALGIYEESHDGWIVDGNYQSRVADLLDRADTVVWLDYPRHVVMLLLVRRTLSRMLLRRRLWHGNREQWRFLINPDPEVNILLWVWSQHAALREQYETASATAAGCEWVRLRHPRDARRWLDERRPVNDRSAIVG